MSLNQLYSAYLGELYGIAFFTAFAKKYSDDTHIKKWQLLIQIEQITAQKLQSGLDAVGLSCPENDLAMQNKGEQDAEKWLDLPWNDLINTLLPWVAPYAQKYQEQAATATEHHELFNLVQQHEDAIYAFLQAEQQSTGSGVSILETFISDQYQ
ncbi:hypothetical protein [Photobacterium nomapromontoriensis]|uniref:hypothetical protein n=1 Tax=Photobacterium nomapromontoriensis TaxID=2910237 RepID=UPI003D0CE372